MRRTLIPTVAVAILVFAAACSDNNDQEPPQAVPAETQAPTEAVSPTPEPEPTTEPEPEKTDNGTGVSPPATSIPRRYGDSCYGMADWNLKGEHSSVMSGDRVVSLDPGWQANGCDRLVFNLSGTAPVGYTVQYGPVPLESDESTLVIDAPVVLAVTINAWPKGYDSGTANSFAAFNTQVYPDTNPKGLKVVEVVVAAGAFEGYTMFGVGLPKKRPFRVFTTDYAGHEQLVIEILN